MYEIFCKLILGGSKLNDNNVIKQTFLQLCIVSVLQCYIKVTEVNYKHNKNNFNVNSFIFETAYGKTKSDIPFQTR